MSWIEKEQEFALAVYPKRDVTLVRGDGALIWDDVGNEYIDCVAGIAVASVGHANPAVAEAIANQARRLITCPGIFYNDTRATLMEKLVTISPSSLKRVFLCNSGTEAMEAALKFARISTGKNGFISAMRGFHGRSMGALSATYKYRQEFEPLIPGHRFVPYNNIEKMKSAIDDTTAAVVLEVIQGEGGVRPADHAYLEQVRALCDEHGILLIFDEIQTGFARTGALFACEHSGVEPDMMALAKAMGGGFPIGAVLCGDKITSASGKHGSTFGGSPLACAAANAAIDFILEQDLATRARELGDTFVAHFDRELPAVRELRQTGLMIGIELKIKSRPVIEALLGHHILALPAGPTVVRLVPPLVISEAQIIKVAEALNQILAEQIL